MKALVLLQIFLIVGFISANAVNESSEYYILNESIPIEEEDALIDHLRTAQSMHLVVPLMAAALAENPAILR